MKRHLLYMMSALCLLPHIVFSDNTIFPHLTQGNLMSPTAVPEVVIIHDSTDTYWTIFSSNFLGFQEFWVAYSRDTQNWSRPLYSGIPVLPTDNYHIRVKKHQIDFDWQGELDAPSQKTYYRSFIDTTISGYTIHKYTLYADTDADGLTDLAEQALRTDIFEPDTDGDGQIDSYDQNPLAAPAQILTVQEKLHKTIIEFELEEFYSNQLILVEQFNNKVMEYQRHEGIVLSMSTFACDVFVSETGYGVPILTCDVTKGPNQRLTASFQFFVTPEDAWGYDVTCLWDRDLQDFVDFQVVDEWVAE